MNVPIQLPERAWVVVSSDTPPSPGGVVTGGEIVSRHTTERDAETAAARLAVEDGPPFFHVLPTTDKYLSAATGYRR